MDKMRVWNDIVVDKMRDVQSRLVLIEKKKKIEERRKSDYQRT